MRHLIIILSGGVENNYFSVPEKTELEIAKQTLKNSKDPAEREKAQQKYDALLE